MLEIICITIMCDQASPFKILVHLYENSVYIHENIKFLLKNQESYKKLRIIKNIHMTEYRNRIR